MRVARRAEHGIKRSWRTANSRERPVGVNRVISIRSSPSKGTRFALQPATPNFAAPSWRRSCGPLYADIPTATRSHGTPWSR